MTSRLELIPRDILQHIAVLVGSSSPLQPPVDVLSLALANSLIHNSLSLNNASHVYASIFSSKFDSPSILNHHSVWTTNSGLSYELVQRLRLLKRSSRCDLSPEGLVQDLWTAYWMLCEGRARNEQQLANADFPGFMLEIARRYLPSSESSSSHRPDCHSLKQLIVWLLTLSLSRRTLRERTPKDRDELRDLIFPYMYLFKRVDTTGTTCYRGKTSNSFNSCDPCRATEKHHDPLLSSITTNTSAQTTAGVYLYGQRHTPVLADASFAAIGMSSALKEIYPLTIPKHLPSRRNGQPFLGLTQEDMQKMAAHETPLFADSMPEMAFPERELRLENYNLPRGMEQGYLLGKTVNGLASTERTNYTLGSMTGLWEGVYFGMSEESNGPSVGFRKYLQCNLVEFYAVDRRQITTDKCHSNDAHYINTQTISELRIQDRRYRKFSPSVHPDSPADLVEYHSRPITKNARNPDPTSKVILMGETLEEHDHAWGGYVFSGSVDHDGLIRLRRESKEGGDVHHFEGRLLFGNVFVGRCGISTNGIGHGNYTQIDQAMDLGRIPHQGIFSMRKVSES